MQPGLRSPKRESSRVWSKDTGVTEGWSTMANTARGLVRNKHSLNLTDRGLCQLWWEHVRTEIRVDWGMNGKERTNSDTRKSCWVCLCRGEKDRVTAWGSCFARRALATQVLNIYYSITPAFNAYSLQVGIFSCPLCLLIFTTNLWSMYYYTYFIDNKIDSQKVLVPCLKSHSSDMLELGSSCWFAASSILSACALLDAAGKRRW